MSDGNVEEREREVGGGLLMGVLFMSQGDPEVVHNLPSFKRHLADKMEMTRQSPFLFPISAPQIVNASLFSN